MGNALLVGPVLDLGLNLLPSPHLWVTRAAFLVAAIMGVAVATGLYVGAGWGPGPRDGLMTGLADKGIPIFAARAAIEVTVLFVGWALGGNVGIGTALFALTIGSARRGVSTAPQRLTAEALSPAIRPSRFRQVWPRGG